MTSTLFNTDDRRYMAEAIRLAARGLYTTHPNPRVGCVLVKEGQIVGRGWHQVAGQGHAEVNALRQAGERARGATAYVSLEPCSHQGKTPPCANALIEAGVARVISAMQDPNPLVSGRGEQTLRDAGINAASGLMQADAEALNPGFIKRMTRQLPWVTVKSAMSVDGRTAMANGESQWITGPAARADVQRLRARSEAIITGVGTVLADDPSLTVRPSLWPQPQSGDDECNGWSWPQSFEPLQPIRVVLDSALRTPPQAQILKQAGATLIVCSQWQDERARALQEAGAEVVALPDQRADQSADESGVQRVDLQAVLALLAQREVNEVLVEAGSEVAGSFVQQGLADQWVCYMAPMLMGQSARPVLGLHGINSMSQAQPLQWLETRQIGPDLRLTFRFGEST